MDLRKFDLNLLLVLDALLRDRSVTLAAQRLGISQPTVSAALNRLRTVFQDELFVKTSRGVEPTQLARELENVVGEILETIHSGVLNRTTFQPETTERTFVVIAGELGQSVFVDRVLLKFMQAAPRARIRFIFPDANERVAALEDGRADLAMGYFPQFARANLFQQLLYSRPLVCVARTGHPALSDGALTTEKFVKLDHVVVAMLSNLNEVVESELRRQGITRRVAVELGHASGAGYLLANSDLIAVVPELLAAIYCRSGDLQKWPVPLFLPRYDVKQYWHRTVNKDPAVCWLRNLLAAEYHPGTSSAQNPVDSPARRPGPAETL
jgi:DNA-binding transcriptional LysR family regulator